MRTAFLAKGIKPSTFVLISILGRQNAVSSARDNERRQFRSIGRNGERSQVYADETSPIAARFSRVVPTKSRNRAGDLKDETPYTRPLNEDRPGPRMPTSRHMKTKVALMGEGGVGKTSLIRRFVLNEYQDTYLHTIGTRVSKIELQVPYGPDVDVQMDMSIFDIMGQRGFRELVRETYYHGAQALVAVCDLTRRDSLYALNEWISSAMEIAGDVPAYVLVNKKDLKDRRDFDDEDVRKLAEPFGAPYVFTSARTGEFVEDAFNAVAIEIVDRAFRHEKAKAVERGLREKILVLLAKRGGMGLKKNQFFEILQGVNFDDLQTELSGLEREGFVILAWHGPSDFTAIITSRGVDAAKSPVSWDEE